MIPEPTPTESLSLKSLREKPKVGQSLFAYSRNENAAYILAVKEKQSLACKAYLKVELNFIDPIFIDN